MNSKKFIKIKKKNKKWTHEEINIVLNYMKDHPELEVPTAQIYYKKLIATTGISCTWDLLRWKVRHLKVSFKKANSWRNSMGAGALQADTGASSVEGKVLQICPFYNQLCEILETRTEEPEMLLKIDSIKTEERESPVYSDSYMETSVHIPDVACADMNVIDEVTDPLNTVSTAEALINLTPHNSSTLRTRKENVLKKSKTKSSSACKVEQLTMLTMKLAWKKEKHDKNLLLVERKLKLMEQKQEADIDLKKRKLELKATKIEKKEKLKILEIEKDERLKKFEIEMAYKYKNN